MNTVKSGIPVVLFFLTLGIQTGAHPQQAEKDRWSDALQVVNNRTPTGLEADLKSETATRSLSGSASDVQDVLDQINELASDEKKILGQLQENLSLKRSHEAQYAIVDSDISRYEADVSQAQSYCTGSFPEPEYSRRVAACNSKQTELNARQQTLTNRKNELDSQEASRLQAARALKKRYDSVRARAMILQGQLLRLKAFERANRDCAEKLYLEDMHQCMQSIWDGARR